jgi:hypothetical protein
VIKNSVFAFLSKFYSDDQIEEDVVYRACRTNGGKKNAVFWWGI